MKNDSRLIQPGDDAEKIKEKTINYLRTHRNYYSSGNQLHGKLWNIVSFTVIILGTATSILAALNESWHVPSWIIIVLPAISALLSTSLLQFRIKDLWQLRDEGRIETELLICNAHLIPTGDRDQALKAAMELRKNAIKLELEQSRRFFSVIGQPTPIKPPEP